MSEIGGQKCIFPTLGQGQLWTRSGRWEKFGSEMFRLKDRAGRSYCLQPTHEEEVCRFVSGFDLNSSALPLKVYQISSKFRDEIQPKLGLLRCREFLMKDLYSFDLDLESAKKTYDTLSKAYSEIFHSLNLPIFKVSANGGLMGDCPSDEFHCPLPVGEDMLLVCRNCKRAVLALETEFSNCPDCGSECEIVKSVELAHCFLLGDLYTSSFNVKTSARMDMARPLQMGCYGIGVTRLLATALEHFTTLSGKESPSRELRWPLGFAPFSGAIALQKENAKDAVSATELNSILSKFKIPTSLEDDSPAYFLARGDILVDDRLGMSLGRKLVDLKQLGIPWVLIAKAHRSNTNLEYELVDVNNGGVSYSANLDEALAAFTQLDFRPFKLWSKPVVSK
nr:prolyl tRNA synthetase mitochondrial [Hymenolepis microstoma]